MDTSQLDFEKADKESKTYVKNFKSEFLIYNFKGLNNIGLYENFKFKHMDSLKLFPMGKVYHIQDYKTHPIRKGGDFYDFVLREIDEKEYFDEIIFSRQMVKHHFPSLYEESLSSTKVLYQNYLHKAVNKGSSSISSAKEVKPYTN